MSHIVGDSGASVRHVQYCWDVSLSSAAVRKRAHYQKKDAADSQNEYHKKQNKVCRKPDITGFLGLHLFTNEIFMEENALRVDDLRFCCTQSRQWGEWGHKSSPSCIWDVCIGNELR